MSKVYETKNYDIFEKHTVNRSIKKINYLEKSMRLYGWINALPMIVKKTKKSTFTILDGHHRFHVAQKLGLPAKYIVDESGINIHEIVISQNQWTVGDFMDSYAREGRPEYLVIKEYHEQTGIPLGCVMSLLGGESAGSGNKKYQFISGEFKVKKQKHASEIRDIVLYLKNIGISFASTSNFVIALSKMLHVKEFDPSRFKGKAKSWSSIFEKQVDVKSYLNEIEKIYNRQAREKHPIAYLASELSRQRQESFGGNIRNKPKQ